MTATPRTQALWMKHHAFSTEEEASEALCDFRDHGNALETELAAAQAECERLKFASEGHLLKTIQQQAELAHLRAELAVAENWVEHHSKHAYDLIAENVKLRADLERFTGHGLLDCHAICDQRDAAIARAERAEAERDALAKDKARLDWLSVSDAWFDYPATGAFTPDTMRAAIDAAMKGTP